MSRKKLILLLSIAVIVAVFNFWQAPPPYPKFDPSDKLPSYTQSSFKQYVDDTYQWLMDNRHFQTSNKNEELALVMPKEWHPEKSNGQAVLLVHGLGDSPYSFVDVAEHLVSKGYLVRTILLPGHSSRPADLALPDYRDWQAVVEHHVQLLQAKKLDVWLGGYSTGANLVTSYASTDENIQGLLLFAPAFKPINPLTGLAQFAKYIVNWGTYRQENNYLRYNSFAMGGVDKYHESTVWVNETLASKLYSKPVFMILSEADGTIDSEYAYQQFSQRMPNNDSHLVWLGEMERADSRSTTYSMRLPDLRVTTGSHMAMLYSPDNAEYGQNPKQILCMSKDKALCKSEEVWFAERGYQDANKVSARTSYNPHFSDSMLLMDGVMTRNAD